MSTFSRLAVFLTTFLLILLSTSLQQSRADHPHTTHDKRSDVSPFPHGGLSVHSFTARSSSFGKRDGEGDDDGKPLPDGYATQLAYFSPDIATVISIAENKSSAEDLISTFRQEFISACADVLRNESDNFTKNMTYGWYTLSRDDDQQDQVNDGVIVVKVACYETASFDPTGQDPGAAVADHTASTIAELKWDKDTAAAQGEDLIKAYQNYVNTHGGSGEDSGKGKHSKSEKDGSSGDKSSSRKRKRQLSDALFHTKYSDIYD